MQSEMSAMEERAPLSASAAFVVHLTDTGRNAPEELHGRVEHVRSGQSTRFTSVADLLGFMRRVLTDF